MKTDALGRPIRLGGFYAYVFRQDKFTRANRIVSVEHETKTGVTVRVLLEARVTYKWDQEGTVQFRTVRDTSVVNIMACNLFPVPAETVKNLQGV